MGEGEAYIVFGAQLALWVCILLSVVMSYQIANRKGYNGLLFAILAMFTGPIAYIIVYLLKPRIEEGEDESDRFPCPECGESIAVAAKYCRFCQCILTEKDKPQEPDPEPAPPRRNRRARNPA